MEKSDSMAKWADFLISAVKYDDNQRIVQVKQHTDTGENIGDGEIVDRMTLANNLKKGRTYSTVFSNDTNWKLGDRIHLIRTGGEFAIRTDTNKVERDNLKFLPELE